MKLKVLYFLLPMAAAASIFTFCTKESTVVPGEQVTTPDQSVTDRAKCTVTVTVNSGSVSVCGTNTQLSACTTLANGEILRGTDVVVAPNAKTYTVLTDDGPTVNGYLVLTNTCGICISSVTVTTASGSVTFPVSSTRTIQIDPTCAPTVI